MRIVARDNKVGRFKILVPILYTQCGQSVDHNYRHFLLKPWLAYERTLFNVGNIQLSTALQMSNLKVVLR